MIVVSKLTTFNVMFAGIKKVFSQIVVTLDDFMLLNHFLCFFQIPEGQNVHLVPTLMLGKLHVVNVMKGTSVPWDQQVLPLQTVCVQKVAGVMGRTSIVVKQDSITNIMVQLMKMHVLHVLQVNLQQQKQLY